MKTDSASSPLPPPPIAAPYRVSGLVLRPIADRQCRSQATAARGSTSDMPCRWGSFSSNFPRQIISRFPLAGSRVDCFGEERRFTAAPVASAPVQHRPPRRVDQRCRSWGADSATNKLRYRLSRGLEFRIASRSDISLGGGPMATHAVTAENLALARLAVISMGGWKTANVKARSSDMSSQAETSRAGTVTVLTLT